MLTWIMLGASGSSMFHSSMVMADNVVDPLDATLATMKLLLERGNGWDNVTASPDSAVNIANGFIFNFAQKPATATTCRKLRLNGKYIQDTIDKTGQKVKLLQPQKSIGVGLQSG